MGIPQVERLKPPGREQEPEEQLASWGNPSGGPTPAAQAFGAETPSGRLDKGAVHPPARTGTPGTHGSSWACSWGREGLVVPQWGREGLVVPQLQTSAYLDFLHGAAFLLALTPHSHASLVILTVPALQALALIPEGAEVGVVRDINHLPSSGHEAELLAPGRGHWRQAGSFCLTSRETQLCPCGLPRWEPAALHIILRAPSPCPRSGPWLPRRTGTGRDLQPPQPRCVTRHGGEEGSLPAVTIAADGSSDVFSGWLTRITFLSGWLSAPLLFSR